MMDIFNRSELLLGKEAMEMMAKKQVIIFGVGGVGSWCAESLVRTGITHLTIVDADKVSETNINRQLMATTKTVGQVKVDVLHERLLEINPDAEITAIQEVYNKETCEHFHLNEYDYVVDCIDSLKDKIDLLIYATQQDKPIVFSSMGAALKVDPTQIRVAEYWNVRGCPLGAMMRKRMRQRKQKLGKKVMCVYSEELLENLGAINADGNGLFDAKKAQINGSLPHITAIFGFMLAGLVIKNLTGR